MFQPNRLNRLRQYITDDQLINVVVIIFIYYNQCIHIIKKYSIKLRENKISTITLWDDLCGVQPTLRKQRSISPDSNKTKQLLSKVKSLQTKCKKQFENIKNTTKVLKNH